VLSATSAFGDKCLQRIPGRDPLGRLEQKQPARRRTMLITLLISRSGQSESIFFRADLLQGEQAGFLSTFPAV
jgi:hypothetical protein